jgi:hypothetical protein
VPIAKGQPWGTPGDVPEGVVRVRSDADARAVLEEARRDRRPFPILGLLGGDLRRTLGGTGPDLTGVRFTVDLGEVMIDGRLRLFVAHLVARNRLWTRAFVAMNAQFVGRWNLGPRAHPNDGLLDTYDVHLAVGQLLAVHKRLPLGAHLPHPGIKEKRTASIPVDLDRPLPVYLDGEKATVAARLVVRVEPDAVDVVV